jgi:hypothetical protein
MKQSLRVTPVIIAFALLLAGMFGGARLAHAQGPFGGDTVPAGETVDHDLVLYGNHIIVDGNVNGDVFAVGDTIDVNGDVTGSLFLISPEASVKGHVGGSVYAGVLKLDLASGSQLGRDLHHAGISLNTGENSQIARNLNAITVGAQLRGKVGQAARAIIGPLEIGRWLMGQSGFRDLLPAGADQSTPTPTPPATSLRDTCAPRVASADPRFVEQTAADRDCVAKLAALAPAAYASSVLPQASQPATAGRWLLGRTQELAALLVLGLVLLWLARGWMEDGADVVRARPLAALGWGLLIAVNGFILALVLAVLIGAVGFGFGAIGLSGLRTIIWLLGYAILGVAFAIFVVAFLFVSKVLVAYWFGRLLLRGRTADRWLQRALALLLGLVPFVLLAGIPVFGAIVSLLVSLMGLGALWLVGHRRWPRQGSPEMALAPVVAEAAA